MTQNILRAWRRILSLFILIFPILAIAMLAWVLLTRTSEPAKAGGQAGPPAPTEPAPDPAPQPTASTGLAHPEVVLQVGDRLSLTFFEKLSFDEEAKWAALSKSRRPPNNFYQRTELSGTFPVEESGVIVIPLLGPIPVAGKSVADFEAAAASTFEQRIGRFGFVSVQVQRQPVYVLGPVKRPGPYEFAPGMTVLHFLSLAGGLDRMTMDLGNMLQVAGESEKRKKSALSTMRLLARLAILSGESEGHMPETPQRLVELAGRDEAEKLLRVEADLRQLKVEAKRTELSGFDSLEQAAKETLVSRRALVQQIESGIELQQSRVADVRTLAHKGQISNAVRLDAEAALSAVKERLQDAIIAVAEAENRIAQIGNDRSKLQNEMKLALAQEVADLRSQISLEEGALTASTNILDAVRPEMIAMDDSSVSGVTFEVVRATPEGHSTMTVPGTFALKPGDLVQVRTRTDGSGRMSVSPPPPPQIR